MKNSIKALVQNSVLESLVTKGSRIQNIASLDINRNYYFSVFQIYLHNPAAVAQVKQLGISIPPSRHGRLYAPAISYENLPEPWGNCGKVPLKFYNKQKYTSSLCMRNCEIEMTMENCKCRSYFMDYTEDDTGCTKHFHKIFNYSITYSA